MMGLLKRRQCLWAVGLAVGLLVTVGLSGCQSDFGGQTLPSPYYMTDDVQYFPPGPEFKLAREAAANKAYSQNQVPPAAQR